MVTVRQCRPSPCKSRRKYKGSCSTRLYISSYNHGTASELSSGTTLIVTSSRPWRKRSCEGRRRREGKEGEEAGLQLWETVHGHKTSGSRRGGVRAKGNMHQHMAVFTTYLLGPDSPVQRFVDLLGSGTHGGHAG